MVPVTTPVSTPVVDVIVATAVLPLVHVPPEGEHVSETLLAGHSVVGPVIVLGRGLTVNVRVRKHPVLASLYVTVVVPVVTVLTIPAAALIVATPVLLLLQVPPSVVLLIVILEPRHTEPGPPITDGKSLTVTIAVVLQPNCV